MSGTAEFDPAQEWRRLVPGHQRQLLKHYSRVLSAQSALKLPVLAASSFTMGRLLQLGVDPPRHWGGSSPNGQMIRYVLHTAAKAAGIPEAHARFIIEEGLRAGGLISVGAPRIWYGIEA